ncbi:hypothetical protein CIHG_05183 [Coccidioides immitis H538.4]|uniref:Uncharacterized protein n=3 Tax=Coccidioides immitis TaxID=5501 RepID=A0A0J8R2P1_COCIT|nr:hypothetical protein CIRG_08255 [Coccidioides immitis RMSCC 2394]KMU78575.1 hypothetical protein CISG_01615 [Coccidioides immitis RMSCC 3703]KMU87389.1 hypothetical protein CIHG_05183 [Coccidioides immitis H538.4]
MEESRAREKSIRYVDERPLILAQRLNFSLSPTSYNKQPLEGTSYRTRPSFPPCPIRPPFGLSNYSTALEPSSPPVASRNKTGSGGQTTQALNLQLSDARHMNGCGPSRLLSIVPGEVSLTTREVLRLRKVQ